MKTLRQLILILSLVLIGVSGYSQGVTPVEVLRVANATTTFDVNIAVGKQIYDIGTDKLYVCKTASVSTLTLTTGTANFTLIGGSGTDAQVLEYIDASHKLTLTNSVDAIIPLAVDDGATEGLASFAAADFTATAGNIVIDYANGQKVSTNHAGFLTAAGYDSITTNATDIDALELLADGKLYVGNGSNVATEVALSNDVTMANTGAVTIEADAVTYAKMQNVVDDERILGRVSGADGVVEELTATQVRTMLNIEDNSEENLTMVTEKFEETSAVAIDHALGHTTVVAYGCRVSLNRATLDPDEYILTTETITITIPVLQYDMVIITYNY